MHSRSRKINVRAARGTAVDIQVVIDDRDGDNAGIGCRIGRLGIGSVVPGSGNDHDALAWAAAMAFWRTSFAGPDRPMLMTRTPCSAKASIAVTSDVTSVRSAVPPSR